MKLPSSNSPVYLISLGVLSIITIFILARMVGRNDPDSVIRLPQKVVVVFCDSGLKPAVQPILEAYRSRYKDINLRVRYGAADLASLQDEGDEVAAAVIISEKSALVQTEDIAELLDIGKLSVGDTFRPLAVGVWRHSRRPSAALHVGRYITARDRGLLSFATNQVTVVDGDKWDTAPRIGVLMDRVNVDAVSKTLSAFESREGIDIVLFIDASYPLPEDAPAKVDVVLTDLYNFVDELAGSMNAPIPVAETDLVLVVEKGNPKEIQSLADLTNEGVRIALCSARFTLLGRRVEELFVQHGLTEAIEENLSYTDAATASDAINRILLGADDATIVYRAYTNDLDDDLEVLELDLGGAVNQQLFATAKDTAFPALLSRLQRALFNEEQAAHYVELGFSPPGERTHEDSP